MKKILNKALSPQVFAICYLPYLAVHLTSVINVLSFTRVCLAFFAIWAVAVCVKMYFFSDKKVWTNKAIMFLFVFLAACLFSQIVQFEYGGLNMIVKLCYFAICILLLYSMHSSESADYIKLISIVTRTLGIVIGIMMLVCDWMFIELFKTTITIRTGASVAVGFSQNRLFGIFTSPNVGGMYALILIWCSILTIELSKNMRFKNLWRTLSAVQIFLATMYISAALSRGTHLSGIAFVVSYIIIRAPFAKEKGLKIWKRVALRAVSAALAIVLCVACLNVVRQASCAVMEWKHQPEISQSQSNDQDEEQVKDENSDQDKEQEEPAKDTGKQELIEDIKLGSEGRDDVSGDNVDITNKRMGIWKTHLSILEGKHYLIGVNNPLIYVNKSIEAGKTFTKEQLTMVKHASGNMHNGYLQIFINGGIVALIPMVIFLALCVIKALKYLGATVFTAKLSMDSTAYKLFSLTLPLVLAILVNNVVETNFVLMGANFIQAIFWFAAGACVQSINEGVKNKW